MNLSNEQIQDILDGAPEGAGFYADYFGYFTCNHSGVWMQYNPSGFSGAKWFRFCELRMESMKPMHRLDDLREIITLRQEVERLKAQQSEVAARAVEDAVMNTPTHKMKVDERLYHSQKALLDYANQLRKGEGDD